jgi:electron-transferring-flavoprotein dehydrogenase
MTDIERESMEFDLLIVGAGPAGLAAAIRAKQKAAAAGMELSVCVIEKAAEVGAHILSGAVMDPRALTELLPDWKTTGAPLDTPVTRDRMFFLSETGARAVPNSLLPQSFHNDGNYIVRLGHVVKWLGEQAEALGVEVYAGFAGSSVLFDDDDRVAGVITGDMGVGRDGRPGSAYQPGMACAQDTRCSPKAAAAIWASSSKRTTTCATASIRRPTVLASRNCGKCRRRRANRVWSCTPPAGRLKMTPTAVVSSIT